MKSAGLLFSLLILSSCASFEKSCPPDKKDDVVYVVGQGWHTDIGIPVKELDKHKAFYANLFPGAKVIMFGYGKKTFVTAPPQSISEYILGPVPGPAAIHMSAISVAPTEAYDEAVAIALPKGGNKKLAEYIWDDLVKDEKGQPKAVGKSEDPPGLFYAAVSEYNLLHTCNTWTADALHSSGLPISGDGVTFSGQTISRINEVIGSQCPLVRNGN